MHPKAEMHFQLPYYHMCNVGSGNSNVARATWLMYYFKI
jgi:hypothetical protein